MKISFKDVCDHWSVEDRCVVESDCVPRVGDYVVLPVSTEYGSGVVVDVVWFVGEESINEAQISVRKK